MAKFAATDYKITINGATFSTNLNSVELALSADDLETTAFGGEWRTRIAGLKSGSLTLNFMQDFGAASIDATLYPLFGSNATVVISPTSSAIGTVNPGYSAVFLVNAYSPFASSVGDIATLSVTWPSAGTVTRIVSA
jgi:predicted secreted protein